MPKPSTTRPLLTLELSRLAAAPTTAAPTITAPRSAWGPDRKDRFSLGRQQRQRLGVTLSVGFIMLAAPVLQFFAALVLMGLGMAAMVLGLGDTWADWRNRARSYFVSSITVL